MFSPLEEIMTHKAKVLEKNFVGQFVSCGFFFLFLNRERGKENLKRFLYPHYHSFSQLKS